MKKFFGLIILFIFLNASEALADRIDRSHRLNALRSATGKSTNNSLFDARLSATYDISATTERLLTAKQDADIRQQNLARENAKLDAKYSTGFQTQDLWQLQKEEAERKEEEIESASGLVDGKMNSSERQYQIDIFKTMADRAREEKELYEKEQAMKKESAQTDGESPTDTLDDGLANNPFYFGENKDIVLSSDGYMEKKSDVIRRLMDEGYDRASAQIIADATTSREHLLIYLMENEGYTYLEAKSIADAAA